MWTAWPVLLGVSKQPASSPLQKKIPLRCLRTPGLIYIAWEQIFLTTWVIDSYKAQMFSFSTEGQSKWHKLLLIKILTIHGILVFTVNMAMSRSKCWQLGASREYGRLSESTFQVSWGGNAACGAVSCGTTGAFVQLTHRVSTPKSQTVMTICFTIKNLALKKENKPLKQASPDVLTFKIIFQNKIHIF